MEERQPVIRKKISIRPIPEARKRQVTFMKRKKGLLKKAKELSILCDCDMAVIIFDKYNQVFNFSSGDINATLERFEKAANSNHVQRESKSNKDYRSLAKLGDEEYVDDNDVDPGQYGDNGYNKHNIAELRYGIGERQDEDDCDEAGIYGEKTTTSSGSSPEDDGKRRQEDEDWGGPRSRSGRRLRLDTEKAAGMHGLGLTLMTSGGRPGDSEEGSGLCAGIPSTGGGKGTKISPVFEQNSASSGQGGNPMAGGASADSSECCASGSGSEGAGSGSGCSGSDSCSSSSSSSSSSSRPGKLDPDVHAAMTARLVRWAEDENPGRSMPGRAEKDCLADECGVSVRSIEYWFWARNKRLRGAATRSPSQSPGGSRKRGRGKPPTLAPLPPINPEEAADRADGGVGLSFFEQHEQHYRQQQVQLEAAAATARVAEDEDAAAGDNEDSDADEEENYSHSRRYSPKSLRHNPRGRRHSPHGSQQHRSSLTSSITSNGFKYDFGAKKMMISAATTDDEDEDHDGKDREGQKLQPKPLPSEKAGLTRTASGGLGSSTPCSLSDVLSGSSPTSSLMSASSPQASWHTAILDEEEQAITTSAEASAEEHQDTTAMTALTEHSPSSSKRSKMDILSSSGDYDDDTLLDVISGAGGGNGLGLRLSMPSPSGRISPRKITALA